MTRAYEIQGDVPADETAYREAARLDATNLLCPRALGALLVKRGEYAAAASSLQAALALDSNDSQSLLLLARAREGEDALPEAASLLERAAHTDPQSRRVHGALAEVYFRQKRLADAEREQAAAANLEDRRIQQWTLWGADPGTAR